MHSFYKTITTIGIVATLGGLLPIVRETPTLAQTHDSMQMDMGTSTPMEHNNTGSRGTPPGKFHFLTDDEHAALRFYNQGLEKLGKNNYKEAIASFTQVLKLTPYYDMAYYNRGNAHRQLGEYKAALDDYSNAVKTNPSFTYLRYDRGYVREALGDIKGAIEDYTAAIESYPEEGTGYSNRGFARYKLGDMQGAMADLNEAIAVNSGYAGSYANRASIYTKLGKHTEAIADYQKAKELYLEQGMKGEYLKVTLAMNKVQHQSNSAASVQ